MHGCVANARRRRSSRGSRTVANRSHPTCTGRVVRPGRQAGRRVEVAGHQPSKQHTVSCKTATAGHTTTTHRSPHDGAFNACARAWCPPHPPCPYHTYTHTHTHTHGTGLARSVWQPRRGVPLGHTFNSLTTSPPSAAACCTTSSTMQPNEYLCVFVVRQATAVAATHTYMSDAVDVRCPASTSGAAYSSVKPCDTRLKPQSAK